jgi:hypothetical protein
MCKKCDWQETCDLIDTMMTDADGRWEWAEATLEGIDGWISDNEHATDRQKSAVKNIHQAGLKPKKKKKD